MKLSVIIVSYNVAYFLEQALLSVRRAAKVLAEPVEILVVDNHSADHSVAMVRARFPEVILLENQHNLGFASANNQALRCATGQYCLLLNPDTLVEEMAFRRCCDFMDAHPATGGLGVQMLDGQGRFLPESKRGLPTPAVAFYKLSGLAALLPRSRTFGHYHLGYLSPHQTHPVEVLSGAYMWLRRTALDQVGLLDEEYFMYGEDIDLSYRLLQGGWQNYYLPTVRIVHYKGESTRRTSVNYVRMFYRAMVIFARKHYAPRRASAFSLLLTAAIWGRAGASLLRLLAPRPRPSQPPQRLALVGSAAEAARARALLAAAGVPAIVVGRVALGPCPTPSTDCLGSLAELPALVHQHGLTELVFCGQDLPTATIIEQMQQLPTRPAVRYRILPAGSSYIIGSSQPHTNGDYYTQPAATPP